MKTAATGENSKNTPANGFIYEKTLIESGLKKLGIDGGYEIVIADNPDIVENTAAEKLRKFLGKGGLKAWIVQESKSNCQTRFLLGRDANLKAITHSGDSGELKIRDVSAEDDGFHLKRIGQDFVVAGSNSRGVLYGVYAFEDFINAGANDSLDIRRVPHFRKRMSAPGQYFNRINFVTEGLPEEKAAYLSRVSTNQVVVLDLNLGIEATVPYCKLHTYVKSDIFTFQPPPSPDLQAKLKNAGAICKKYGIDLYFWFEEPATPQIAGGVDNYPPEALGMVRRPWGGGPTGLEKTLCINSPIVQAHYRSMVKKFVREYPDVKGFAFYNLDGSSWLCTPELCERCGSIVKDSPHNLHNPWESQSSFVTLLAQAAWEERPDFEIRFWGNVHFTDNCEKLLRKAQYSSLMCSWTGGDRDVIIPDNVEPDIAFDISSKVAKDRRLPLYGLIEFNNLEAVSYSLPFPFAVCNAIKRYEKQGLQHIMEFAGPIPGHNPVNALVAQNFLWNPYLSPSEFLQTLSTRQFGKHAGQLMFKAWEEIRDGMNVWNNYVYHPLCGSQMQLSIGTPVGLLPPAILPDIVKYYNSAIEIRIVVEPWRGDDYQKFKEQEFMVKMGLMAASLAQAAVHANKAVAAASDIEFIGICYYEGMNGRQTQKEYAELNYASIAIAAALCRQRCDMLQACRLLTEMENARAADDKKTADTKNKMYRKLIRENIGVQARFCELLMGFAGMRPCYTRTSLTEREISDLLSDTRAKIDKLKEFLAKPLEIKDKDNAHV